MKLTRRLSFVLLAAVFVVSRVVYYAFGVRFNTGAIGGAIQVLPKELLQHDLVRSLWYLHAQPPAFNAMIGIALHSPLGTRFTLQLAYWGMGLGLTFAMYLLMRELGVSSTPAFVVTVVYIVTPTFVLFENWMFYDTPVAFLLALGVLCFTRYVRRGGAWNAAGFAAAFALLGLGRASFHVLFLVVAGALLVWAARRIDRRTALIAALVPVVLTGALLVKNEVLFGEAQSSTWLGMNLAHMIFRNHPEAVQRDVADKKLSPQALVVPFVGLNRYPNASFPRTGVPALDDPTDTGHANFNNKAYIKISNDYAHDVRVFLQRHPGFYVTRVGESFRTSFAPALDYQAFKQNRPHIAFAASLESRLLGQVHGLNPVSPRDNAPKWDEIAWVAVLAYLVVIGAGVAAAGRAARRRSWGTSAPLIFIAGTVVYLLAASNFLELGDNMRFRFETDPLVVCAVAAVVTGVLRRRQTAAAVVDLTEAEVEPVAVS
jgi:hypothetical protein